MKYFLDSAKPDEIIYALENWGIAGVTTNPKHVMNSGLPFESFLAEAKRLTAGLPDFPVLVEINPHLSDRDGMIAAAERLAAYCENFVIKIPCCEAGLNAIYRLGKSGIRTAATLVFTPAQAMQAANVGAEYAALFVGRIDEAEGAGSGIAALSETFEIFRRGEYRTKLLAAAMRGPRHITDSVLAGCDCVTCGADMLRATFEHTGTEDGLKKFRSFWDSTDTTGWN